MDQECGRPTVEHPTERELEVLELVADGMPNGDIAQRLFITDRTVKFHLSNYVGSCARGTVRTWLLCLFEQAYSR